MSVVEGVRDAEKREAALFIGIEARMLQVHCGENGAKEAHALLARAYAIDEDPNDECDDLDLEPSTPLAADIIESRERREAEEYYAALQHGDDGEEEQPE